MSFSFAYQSRIFPHGIVDLGQFPRFRSHNGALGRTPIQSACADLHVVDGELPNLRYPIVPGHEIVGRVDFIGPNVTTHRVGDP